jgi:hypothetical protein
MEMCGFEKMREEKGKMKGVEIFLKKDFNFFRKGKVGLELDMHW